MKRRKKKMPLIKIRLKGKREAARQVNLATAVLHSSTVT